MAATTIEGMIPEAFMEKLAALVLSPVLPIAYPNVPFTPPVDAQGKPKPYLQATFLPNQTRRLIIGNNEPHEFKGIFQVIVNYPSGAGIVTPYSTAGKIAEHFAEGTQLQTLAGPVRIDERPSIDAADQDTDRIQIPVSIYWIAYL